MQYFTPCKCCVHLLHKYSTIFLFVLALTAMTTEVIRADSPPNLNADIPWIAGQSNIEDTLAAFNHGRRQEEIQLGLAPNTLGTLDLPPQAEWDQLTVDQKALLIINEERTDRAGMLPNVIGLPLEGIEPNIDNIAQVYAQVLVDSNRADHYADGSDPFLRIDNDPVLGGCHEFLNRAENLYYSWTSSDTPPLLQIEQALYLWIYADADKLIY